MSKDTGGELVPFRRRKHRTTKYDWNDAWMFFASSPTITFKSVAAEKGIPYNTVLDHAKREKWTARREELMHQVIANRDEVLVRALTQRHNRTIQVAEKLRDTILAEGVEIEVKDAVSALPAYAKLEQLYGGGATENLQALPMINTDNLTGEEMEELARLLEKGRGEEGAA